ncbi:nonstructural protein [Tortoise microvirus 68]|nr:nonstructural protein [Tortoise microvirus 68]
MIYNFYSVRDQLVGFMTPVLEVNDSVAVRNFTHAVKNKDSLMYSHSKYYDLYRIGVFDSDTGKIDSVLPDLICSGSSVLIDKE